MEAVILGSGTSTGIPVLGCGCTICNSGNPRHQRTRVSVAVHASGKTILIDTSPDLRFQALREKISRVDAVLFTHAHADHAHGIDDIRLFNYNNGYREIPAYAAPETAETLLARFGYAFGLSSYPGSPRLKMTAVQEPFTTAGMKIVPVPVPHGPAGLVLGFRIGSFAYVTDCNDIPPASIELLRGVNVLVLDALRKEPHPTHLHLERSLELAAEIRASRTFFTHLSHDINPEEDARHFPEGVAFAYDGLRIQVPEEKQQ